jgi:hypothetical protein
VGTLSSDLGKSLFYHNQYLYYELGIVRSNIESVICHLFVAFAISWH